MAVSTATASSSPATATTISAQAVESNLAALVAPPTRSSMAGSLVEAWSMRRQVPFGVTVMAVVACVVLVAGPIVYLFAANRMSVKLVPTQESLALTGSQKISADETIDLYARAITGIQYAWDQNAIQTMPDRMMPFLSPKIQQKFRDEYAPLIADAKRYQRINFATPVAVKVYHIDGNDTAARVAVALDVSVFVFDPVSYSRKFARFDKVVATYYVVQRPISRQNQFGLVVEDIKEEDWDTYQKAKEKFW